MLCRTFSEITKNATIATKLQSTYGDINNIDAWLGALCEDHVYVSHCSGIPSRRATGSAPRPPSLRIYGRVCASS